MGADLLFHVGKIPWAAVYMRDCGPCLSLHREDERIRDVRSAEEGAFQVQDIISSLTFPFQPLLACRFVVVGNF